MPKQRKPNARTRARTHKGLRPGVGEAAIKTLATLAITLGDQAEAPAIHLLDTLTSDQRKTFPLTTGFLDYFTDAVAEASQVSFFGNEKHNPGQPLHWSRGKSSDHADCIMRHLAQRGGFDVIVINGKEHKVRHSAALLWRAAALCQEEIEREKGLAPSRGSLPPR